MGIYYSEKLQEIIKENQPQEVEISLEEILVIIKGLYKDVLIIKPGEDIPKEYHYIQKRNTRENEVMIILFDEETCEEHVVSKGLLGLGAVTVLKKSYLIETLDSEESCKVTYSPNFCGEKLIFEPSLLMSGRSTSGQGKVRCLFDRRSEILESLNTYKPISIDMEEEVVVLPTADYRICGALEWGSPSIDNTLCCFKSEGVPYIEKLLRQVNLIYSVAAVGKKFDEQFAKIKSGEICPQCVVINDQSQVYIKPNLEEREIKDKIYNFLEEIKHSTYISLIDHLAELVMGLEVGTVITDEHFEWVSKLV